MKNIYQFNKIIYKGNINRDFYIYNLKKNPKLIKYLLINIINFIISVIILSKKELYEKNKFKYLKDINDLEKNIDEFYNKKNRYNKFLEIKEDSIIIDRVPLILIRCNNIKNIVGYELNEEYCVDIEKYRKELGEERNISKLFIRNVFQLPNINCDKLFIVNNNRITYLKRRKYTEKLFKLLIIIILSFILTCMSFFYTNYVVDINMIKTYYEPLLFILNFIPVFMSILLLYFITKKLHFSFLITSILVLLLGIANQNKLLYRDDVVKFEDLTVIKETMTMTKRYSVFIKWYTILAVILIIIVFFFLRRYIKKYKIETKKQIILIILNIILIIFGHNIIYTNSNIYDKVGDKSLINIWIDTKQSQIRGLIYPFDYSINEMITEKPDNYDEKIAENILNKYEYEDISEDKKVNIIAIMLEAYNDFSKYDFLEFNEDIYEKLHDIEKKSISGNLVTTIFGGGTIVTERNFITGYYDFPSFRKKTNSYAWYFKEQGYRTEAMHPIYGAFYNRASVNPNLGFDMYYNYENKFSSVQTEFLSDNDFFDYIIEGYENSKNDNVPYFNFSVTYQNHGPYSPKEHFNEENYLIDKNYSNETYNTFNEYLSGIKKTNEALKKLINYFDNEEEPVIVIFFGDHNPYLGESGYEYLRINLDLSDIGGFENYYETPYVIHANNSAKNIFNKDFIGTGNKISPIFLMNELFDYLGLKGNNYLQYMSDLKENVDVISDYYYKENDNFITKDESVNKDLIGEYNSVNYYYSRNFKEVKNG